MGVFLLIYRVLLPLIRGFAPEWLRCIIIYIKYCIIYSGCTWVKHPTIRDVSPQCRARGVLGRCKAQYICGRGDRPSSGNRVHL